MRAGRWFVAFAIGNGVAAALSLAAAFHGHWVRTVLCVAFSWACAGGIVGSISSYAER